MVGLPPPNEFVEALESLRTTLVDEAMRVREVPAPRGLAPWVAAVEVSPIDSDDESTGVLVILYDPGQAELWGGNMRLVGRATVQLDAEQAGDPLLPQVLWHTLSEELSHVEGSPAVGTVTVEVSETFGGLELSLPSCTGELRCSWTPQLPNLAPHLQAWAEALRRNAGVAPAGAGWVMPHESREKNDE